MAVSRSTLTRLAIAVVVLFAIAFPNFGTVSNIAWYLALIGLLALIVLGVAALIQARRPRTQ